MKAVLRSISSDSFDIDTWTPDDSGFFKVDLLLKIGAEGTAGADNFDVTVCSPAWLEKQSWRPRWGRGLLIVGEYDLLAIKNELVAHVAACEGEAWSEIAHKLSRTLLWEFDDYIP